jgi:hypothetical protein
MLGTKRVLTGKPVEKCRRGCLVDAVSPHGRFPFAVKLIDGLLFGRVANVIRLRDELVVDVVWHVAVPIPGRFCKAHNSQEQGAMATAIAHAGRRPCL